MSEDEENELQLSPSAEEDHGTHSLVTGGSTPLTSKSARFSFLGSAAAPKERKQHAYRPMRELEKYMKRILSDDT